MNDWLTADWPTFYVPMGGVAALRYRASPAAVQCVGHAQLISVVQRALVQAIEEPDHPSTASIDPRTGLAILRLSVGADLALCLATEIDDGVPHAQ